MTEPSASTACAVQGHVTVSKSEATVQLAHLAYDLADQVDERHRAELTQVGLDFDERYGDALDHEEMERDAERARADAARHAAEDEALIVGDATP